ncbi:MAG: rod shape-determining protein RodA [Deltaproteobacteria bacterium]|nr:rod shape-determining protein RodA [Deltaproteobacteria bacterium]
MSLVSYLRRPSTVIGVLCTIAICVVAIDNLVFTDSLMQTTYHRTQTIWFVLGLVGAGLVAAIDPVYVRRVGMSVYFALNLLLVLVLVIGREINYSRRWIELGPMSLQPSEFMKLSIILVVADWFDKRRASENWRLRDLIRPTALVAVPVILINREPDLGTSLVVAAIGGSMILYEGIRGRSAVLAMIVVVLGASVAWETGLIRDYQKGRAEAWYQAIVEEDERPRAPSERTQAEQALWAVGSGRLWGKSDADARQSVLRHLPFVHTDFALAPLCTRFGLAGASALFLLYLGVVGWGLAIANRATERFDALLAIGVSALVFWQFFINAGMVIGLLPVVGITLPLFSYGGSSALTVLVAIGFLLNLSRRGQGRR